jgi:Tfp pilus assembly protein PilN
MRAVNLLPKDAGRSTRQLPKAAPLVLLVGGAALVLGFAGLFMTSTDAVSAREQALASRQAELARIPRPAAPRPAPAPAPGAALAGQRGPRVVALSAALAERVSWDRLLRRFSLVLPDDVWLQTLEATAPTGAAAAEDPAADPAAPAAAQGFTVTGRTYSHAGVARLLSRLTALPDLEDVTLQNSHRVDVAGQDVVEFTIVAGVRADGDAA